MDWTQIAPGVWSAVVGWPDPVTPLGLLGIQPSLAPLVELGEPSFPFQPDAITAETVGHQIVVQAPLQAGEKLFGMGLQFVKLNQRGRTRYLRVNSDPDHDTGETHAPVPFHLSSHGYGLLVNTARIVTVYAGSCVHRHSSAAGPTRDRNTDREWTATPAAERVEIVVTAPGVELFLFDGETPLEVVRRYNLFCGGGCLPPRWGLGFWHRVPTSYSADQVIREAEEFRERDFPCDVIGLEPGWHSKSYPCTFEWDPGRFPEPAAFVETMRERRFEINLWEHPYVSPGAPIYAALEPLSGSHTVWGGLAPDLTLPEAQAILAAQHREKHLDAGIAGYKLDECDGSELTGNSWMFPGHATFPSGLDGEQMRQVYGLLLQKLTDGLFRERDRRTYGLVRASLSGASSLPYVLYSDLYDHRRFVRALCNASFCGLLWTPEIRSAKNAEDWVRRMQTVCFSPLAMLNAWSSGTKPWSFPEVEPIIRGCLELRMRLLPYFYSAFARYHFDGTPPFRAMALEVGRPGDDRTAPEIENALLEADDQYMAGDSLLVAPLFAGQESREVLLPAGDWYDFETGGLLEGGRRIEVDPGLEKLPLFVRDGGIIPLMPPLPSVPRAGEAVPLEVRHYGTAPGAFLLFDDDGETLAYERGDYRWRRLDVEISPVGERQGNSSGPDDGWRSSYGELTWRWLG
jgi:alpha-glucosidase (family GH31 glycosyl hydrolase)